MSFEQSAFAEGVIALLPAVSIDRPIHEKWKA